MLGLYNRLSTNTVNRCTHAFRHLYKYIHTYADAHPATVDFSCVHCWCGTDLFSPLSRNGHSKGGFEKLQQSIYGHYYYHYCHRAHRQVSLAPGSIVPHQHLISVLTYVQFSHFKALLCPKLRWRFLKRPHTLNHFPWHHLFSGRPCDSLKGCALDICHMTMGESSSRDRELKFPLRANRNLTLPITLLGPPGSTLGRALEEIASDVIYFTVLFLSFSFLPCSLHPYLFMMFAVIGSNLSGPVVEILISLPASFYSLSSTIISPPPSLCCICGSGLIPGQPISLETHSASPLFPFCSTVSYFFPGQDCDVKLGLCWLWKYSSL